MLKIDDVFRAESDDDEYVVWDDGRVSHYQTIYYVHGALHLFDSDTELRKICWERAGNRPLIEQIREQLDLGSYPLYVAEGNSQQKLRTIRRSTYLNHSLKSFAQIKGAVFVYGHSLSPSDDHLLERIERGKIKRIYVALYVNPASEPNKSTIKRAEQIRDRRSERNAPSLSFIDSSGMRVWR